jgi:hypothetical protein
MSRPPQNLNLIDYALARGRTRLHWCALPIAGALNEWRRRKILKFIALTKIFPLRTHVLEQIRLLGKRRG